MTFVLLDICLGDLTSANTFAAHIVSQCELFVHLVSGRQDQWSNMLKPLLLYLNRVSTIT